MMKKFLLLMGLVAFIGTSFTSCTSMKRDCQGGKHVRLKNGIYL